MRVDDTPQGNQSSNIDMTKFLSHDSSLIPQRPMRLVVTSEFRFSLAPDGSVWTKVCYDYSFWQRYLTVFDSVRIAARVNPDPEIDERYKMVSGPQVDFWRLPFYVGPGQFLRRRDAVRESLLSALKQGDALLCRVGSLLADELLPTLWKTGRPYGLEVVGDPYEAMGPGAIRHPLRPLFRAWATRSLKRQCSRAVAVAYVTREALQRRYPCPAHSVSISDVGQLDFMAQPKVFTTSYSSVSCDDTDFVSEARHFGSRQRPRILFVGSFAQMYKGPDVLIRAIKRLIPEIIPTVVMVGDGKYRAEMEALAGRLGISQHVEFLGELSSGKAVREQLDQATLFVMPSRTEGLPRAMIEAMTRALPCIGSRVGGIPELLHENDLVDAGDVIGLANKIKQVVTSPDRLSEMSKRNLGRANEYRPIVLDERRIQFYRFLRQATERWLGGDGFAKGATA
jgi:glycosyltransferase involved in cell wall biosynthesis